MRHHDDGLATFNEHSSKVKLESITNMDHRMEDTCGEAVQHLGLFLSCFDGRIEIKLAGEYILLDCCDRAFLLYRLGKECEVSIIEPVGW